VGVTDVGGGAPLRVLLVSAVASRDPHSGDVTYTEQLVAHPPPGVEYTTYDRAVADGSLRELGTRGDVRAALGGSAGAAGAAATLGAAALRTVEGRVRATGAVFREPIRVLEADPTAFDLVHVHVFNTLFVGASPPVVMSAAGPLEWVYRDAWGWSDRKVRRANAFDAALAQALDATLHARRLGRARRFVAFSEHLRDWVCANGVPPALVDVVPNYLAPPPGRPATAAAESRAPRRLGFVAKDFRSKGGEEVVAAFAMLRRERPDLELVVVGSEPQGEPDQLRAAGIDWRAFVPRDELLRTVLPGIDVLLHPSHIDGLPYAPMEALAYGVPLVVSDYGALPEMVRGGAGRVSRTRDVADLVRATTELLDADVHARARAAARVRFETAYSSQTQAPALRRSYELARRTS
jgi:glycosyltransferase involved in cell wall biosynthesis